VVCVIWNNSFEFDHCQVLKIKLIAECVGDFILPHAMAKGNAYSVSTNKMSCLEHRG
jgi:hypothetical protein